MGEVHRYMDENLAETLNPWMFYLSLAFLVLLAALMVLWIDVPRVVESYDLNLAESYELDALDEELPFISEEERLFEEVAFIWGLRIGCVLLLMWPLFIAEQVVLYFLLPTGQSMDRQYPFWLSVCLFPPLRLCARHRTNRQMVWLPNLGWQPVGRYLQRRLERAFSIPMVWIALLILPVLALQAIFKGDIVNYPVLRLALHFGTGLIWFAFAAEFIVMVSVAEKKLTYCKKHWLDLVIILLPLVSFLRTLRLLRASRLLQVGRLQQLSKIVRVYRLRGLAMRGLRALLILELFSRLLRTTPEQRIEKLMAEYREKQEELDFLKAEIDELRKKYGLADEVICK